MDVAMHTNIFKIIAFLITSTLITSSALASPKSRNSDSNFHKLQKQDIESMYRQFLKQQANKPKFIKTAYSPKKKSGNVKTLDVTATAYTSHVAQTDSTPNIAAWGDRLRPGMKVIAVSRDLLKVYGLKHKQKVRIKGLEGEYLVLDKMNKRWRKKIDIYMGKNKRKAFKWGRRKVQISWNH